MGEFKFSDDAQIGVDCFLYSRKCLLFFLLKISTRYLQLGKNAGIGKLFGHRRRGTWRPDRVCYFLKHAKSKFVRGLKIHSDIFSWGNVQIVARNPHLAEVRSAPTYCAATLSTSSSSVSAWH
jgi:hypothetical protein